MDEKKPVKISLLTFFLVLSIIIIIIMACFIYKLNKEKTVETEKVANLNNKVSSLQSTVNNLKEKLNNVSTIVNSSTNSNSNTSLPNSSSEESYAEISTELDKDEYLYVTDIEKNDDTCTFKGIIYKKYTIDSSEFKRILSDKKYEINGEAYTIVGNESEGYSLLDKNNEESGYNIFKENGSYYLSGGDFYSYKSTGLNKKITVEQSTSYSNMENEDPNGPKTVKDAFSMELYSNVMKGSIPKEELINNGPLYKFEFQNGKCTKVLNIAYWN